MQRNKFNLGARAKQFVEAADTLRDREGRGFYVVTVVMVSFVAFTVFSIIVGSATHSLIGFMLFIGFVAYILANWYFYLIEGDN